MHPLKKTARIAGLLYLFVVVTGPFSLMYVPGKLFVHGDAMATARNILDHETLFRVYTLVEIVGEVVFVLTVLALFQLLAGVSRPLAGLMVVLILIDVPLALLGVVNHLATFAIVHGADYLAVFDEPQRNALAMLLLNLDRHSTLVSETFWGLWLLPLGALVIRSRFLPRFLGGWLIANGVTYVAMSFTGLLAPHYSSTLFKLATPLLFGEVALMLWLLIVGVRERPPAAAAAT